MYNLTDQRLDLAKANPSDTDQIKGQIVISLLSREQHNSSNSHLNNTAPVVQTVVDALGNVAVSAGVAVPEEVAPSSPPSSSLPSGIYIPLPTFIPPSLFI